MLQKVAAAVLVVGLVLPYACDVRPLTGVWSEPDDIAAFGIPVLAALAYALHTLLPAVARFHERHGPALHGLLRAVYFVLAGVYVGVAVHDDSEGSERLAAIAALVASGALLYWQQQRGTKAARLPLLFLVIVGVAAVYSDISLGPGDLQVGAWIVSAAYVASVTAEVLALRGAARVTHGG